ncbi:metallophosphoesterase family protein [Virgibacillus sp. W0181]|uniref:metallophosphoesterase family protein n=1 Tax=Virgibacillus sp. W0181 TaxID=3391581 RepID=UPI003F46515D
MLFFKKRKKGFKIFYAGDVHGSERCFMKFINAAKFYDAQALVLGGDLTGKAVIPIVSNGSTWSASFLNKDHELHTESEVEQLEKTIRFNGFYPYRTTQDEVEQINNDEILKKQVFDKLMKDSVTRWMEIAKERLEPIGIDLYAIGGNDDEWYIDDVFIESEFVTYIENKVADIGPCQIIGSSYANETPFNSPRELSEEKLYERLSTLAKTLDNDRPSIFNFHVPPYNSSLDIAAELKGDLSMVFNGGAPNMVPVGSKAVRQVIEEFQPILSLHGHIHESKGSTTIGKTICINPGSRYGEGVLDGALITVSEDGVLAHQLVTG